jgi:hypothetical protein
VPGVVVPRSVECTGARMPIVGDHLVHVHLSDWQIECCEPPPVVGGTVSWPLSFHVPDTGPVGAPRPWRAERRGDETFLVDGPVEAHWPLRNGPAPGPGAVEVTGMLVGDVHGPHPEGTRPVTGTVRRVWVESQVYVLRDDDRVRGWVPVRDTEEYRRVERSPQWFHRTDGFGVPLRHDVGVLCELVVPEEPLR